MEKSPDAFRTISEVAADLDLPQHVLRFWETRFAQIKPLKRGGGRRYYRPDDVELLRAIRLLLYGEGYTIKGVQKILKEQGLRAVIATSRGGPVEEGRALASPLSVSAPADLAYADGPLEGQGNGVALLERNARIDEDLVAEPAAANLLIEDDLRQLEAALAELDECARILEVARRS